MIVIVAILLYTSLIFAIETEGPQAEMWSFYDSFWWGLMTLTTVGYDMNPATFFGKFICGLCAVTGIFILTLPIPIVVTSFAACYKNRLWRNEISMKKRMVSTYNQRDHKLSEKRNLFPDLAGAGGFYIPKTAEEEQREDIFEDEEDNTMSLLLTPSTNGDIYSPTDSEGEILRITHFTKQDESSLQTPTPTTETSFLVDGSMATEEKQCLVQHTDV